MANSYDVDNELSGCRTTFFDQLNDYELFKEDLIPWRYGYISPSSEISSVSLHCIEDTLPGLYNCVPR
jgi:hypothetical protein